MKWFVSGVISLAVWIVLTFVAPVGLGVIHVLLGAGVLLVIRGWVERQPVASSQ
jgi:hypothetical protein